MTFAANIYTDTDELLPAPEALFSRICRSTPAGARELSASLPEADRARLALFCNARRHLRDQGRAIAGTCSLAVLMMEGGQAGYVLHHQVGAGPETWHLPRCGAHRITLARS